MDADARFVLDLCSRHRGWNPRRGGPLPPPDLGRVIALATRHKVSKLLLDAWKAHGPPLTDEGWRALKRAAAPQTLVQSLLLDEWARLEPALRSAGVRCLMLKGPALALQEYGDPRAREYRDIDLLVDSETVERAVEAFLAAGFVVDLPVPPRPGPQRRHFLRTFRHLSFVRPGQPVRFEVHATGNADHGLSAVEVRGLFRRAEILEYGGVRYPTLDRRDHAVMAFLHAARHGWATLQWVLDSMKALEVLVPFQGGELRWDHLSLAKACDVFGFWASGLFESTNLERLRPPRGRRTRRAVHLADLIRRSFNAPPQPGALGLARHHVLYLARLRHGWIAAWKGFSHFLHPNPLDFALFQGWLFPGFFATAARPVLLVRRLVKAP